MKILLIDVYNFNKGGAESVCFNTGKMLEEHGNEVVYFTLKWKQNSPSPFEKYFPKSKETRSGPLRTVKNIINYFYHFEAANKIEQLIIGEKPDIAHIHLLWGQITPSIFPVLRKYKIPILFTVHDYRIVCPAYTFRDGNGRICEACRGKFFYRCVTHTCCKNSKLMSIVMAGEQYFRNTFFNPFKYIDGFIYVSNFAKGIQEKHMPLIKAKPSIILYNFSESIASCPKILQEDKYYLYFGRLSYEKGINTLLEAFKMLPNCKLKVVGKGPKENELKDFVCKSNMQNVEFLGYKQGEELTSLVSGAYFVIVPSEWYENNPLSIIESLSLGTPVIGSNIGGIPELIQDEKTGFTFTMGSPADLTKTIRKAIAIPEEKLYEMSIACNKFAQQHFSADKHFNYLISIYQSILKASK